jgi:hypothetical protein
MPADAKMSRAICDLELGSWAKGSASAADFDFEKLDKRGSVDIIPVKFRLCREGKNSNNEAFLRSELLRSWKSPRHKPIDVEHVLEEKESYFSYASAGTNKNTIIGHMTDTALSFDGDSPMTEDEAAKVDPSDDLGRKDSDKLWVLATAVLYMFHFPKTITDMAALVGRRMLKISMENWYRDRTYVVGGKHMKFGKPFGIDDDTEELWRKRTLVGGAPVVKIFNDMWFSGAGVVSYPADRGCVFMDDPQRAFASVQRRHDELHVLYGASPSEELAAEHEELHRLILAHDGAIKIN